MRRICTYFGGPPTWQTRCGLSIYIFFPENIWAKGSSNSRGLYIIFSFSHLHIASSHLYIISPSNLLSLHIYTYHLIIFTCSHLHIYTYHLLYTCDLRIFTSSHLQISSSHLRIYTYHVIIIFSSSHLHISSSHLHMLPTWHLLIFTSAHISSSHLHICSSSHLHIFTSAHFSYVFFLPRPHVFYIFFSL